LIPCTIIFRNITKVNKIPVVT